MTAVLQVAYQILDLYKWVVIIAVIFSWLYAFNVINASNNIVAAVWRGLYQLTEPVFQRVRRFIPGIGGLDLSPIIVIFAIILLQQLIANYIRGIF